MRHIEELCNMTDPLTVLQEPDTRDLCDPEEEGGDEDTGGHDKQLHDGDDLDVAVISHTLHTLCEVITGIRSGIYVEDPADILLDVAVISHTLHTLCEVITGIRSGIYVEDPADILLDVAVISHTLHTLCEVITGIRSGIYVEDPADILLDVNTAANNLLISDDLKTITWTQKNQKQQRFQCNQVMSRRGFTSGRHYWDVDGSRSGVWMVGMCYPSMVRRGDLSLIGYNNKSWGLCRAYNHYSVRHDREAIVLPDDDKISSNRVRFCLDYEAGQLSFYELCDPIRHLYTFTAAFSKPLHAVLGLWDGSIIILGGSSSRKKQS
ncbi:uncharacterized protein ACNLHF_003533 [Anomaloglossus baeobatrachus]